MEIRPLTPNDIPALLALWQSLPGLGLSPDDVPERLAAFMARNPTTCLGACEGNALVGSVLGGYDGRRGYLYHLAVRQDLQGKGYGKALVGRAVEEFKKFGCARIRLCVFGTNTRAREFYRRLGWSERDDLIVAAWNG
ncbi:MAG: GNAT family N-acetyltransferase [Patescibacteria group bacterium]